MTTLLLVLWVLLLGLYVLVLAVRPRASKHSWAELGRRGDEQAMRRERLLGDVYALRRLKASLLLVALALLAYELWQWWSLAIMLAVVLLVLPIVRIAIIRRAALRLYNRYELSLLHFVEKVLIIGWFGRYERFSHSDEKLESIGQLQHLIETSGHVLSEDQQRIIRSGLEWHETTVASIMTKRSSIASIKHSELIGPLVLDDLHKTGHNQFPVIKGTLDAVVGTLDITELLEVTATRTSQTAEAAMSPRALRIESDATLPAALAMLQKSHQHMLIVINQDGKTVGLVTLADITGSLLG